MFVLHSWLLIQISNYNCKVVLRHFFSWFTDQKTSRINFFYDSQNSVLKIVLLSAHCAS